MNEDSEDGEDNGWGSLVAGTCSSPMAWTADDDTDGVPDVAEKLRACMGDVGVLLNVFNSSTLRGVRELFDWKVVDFVIASIWAFLCEFEVNSWVVVFVEGVATLEHFFGDVDLDFEPDRVDPDPALLKE